MRILQLCPQVPFPLDGGGRIGIANITKHLALRGHDISLVCYGLLGEAARAYLGRYCQVKAISPTRIPRSALLLAGLALSTPGTYLNYQSRKMRLEMIKLWREFQPEIVHVDHLQMGWAGPVLKSLFNAKIVLREHNVEYKIWERYVQIERNALKRLYAATQVRRVREYERKLCCQYDGVVAISEIEKQDIARLSGRSDIDVMPAGVDIEHFSMLSSPGNSYSLLFFGGFDWIANIDAAVWFVRSIFPLVRSSCPSAKLVLAGSKPANRVLELADEHVEVISDVEDIRTVVAQAGIVVVPLRMGGGIRIKILESMAMRKPVVSTSVGCEGIDVQHGREILIADNEQAFAACVVRLMENAGERDAMGERGYRRVCERYSWKVLVGDLEAVYHRFATGYRNGEGVSNRG